MIMSNGKDSRDTGLIPPRTAKDGNACQPEPEEKSFAEILAEETSRTRQSALKDIITYLVDNSLNDAGHDIRSAINFRYNMRWQEVDSLISKAQKLVAPEIEKAKLEREKSEQKRIEFEALTALFENVGLQIQANDGGYTLSGLSKAQLRIVADVLSNEGAE